MGCPDALLPNRGPKRAWGKECNLALSRISAQLLRITDEGLVDCLQTAALGIPDSCSRNCLFVLSFYSHWFAHLGFYHSISAGRYRLTLGCFGCASDILFEIRPGLVDKYWTDLCICGMAPSRRLSPRSPLAAVHSDLLRGSSLAV